MDFSTIAKLEVILKIIQVLKDKFAISNIIGNTYINNQRENLCPVEKSSRKVVFKSGEFWKKITRSLTRSQFDQMIEFNKATSLWKTWIGSYLDGFGSLVHVKIKSYKGFYQ